jgi:hypothetical protein
MRKNIGKLMLAGLPLSIVGIHAPALSKSRRRREIRRKPLVQFDWNCASPSAYPKEKPERIVRASAKRESIAVEAEADRAFAFDLNDDRRAEYFVPLVCGATGNCDWERRRRLDERRAFAPYILAWVFDGRRGSRRF